MINKGFRLIGDSKDRKSFFGKEDLKRVRSIISSCVGLVAILPDRGYGKTSPFMLEEIRFGREFMLPSLIVAESHVDLDRRILINQLYRLDMPWNEQVEGTLLSRIDEHRKDSAKKIVGPHYIFFATDFKS